LELGEIVCNNYLFQYSVLNWKINMAGGQRLMLNLKNVDACAVLDNTNLFPMFVNEIRGLNATFPGMIHKCPYTVSLGIKEFFKF
jgi:hypothetical protein